MYKTAPWKHFKTVTQHRWYVFKNCCRVGMPIRGLLHDLSKYSPIEFGESMRYYSGNRSPIDNCKDEKGFSRAWMHHKGKNPHHWEYWIDNIDNGGEGHPVGTLMSYKYAVEMLCDYLGAGQAYEKKNWSPESEWRWWLNKRKHCVMHPVIDLFITKCLDNIRMCGIDWLTKDNVEYVYYDDCLRNFNAGITTTILGV